MGHLLQAQLSPVNATTTVWETTWGEQQLGSITWGAQRFGPSSRSSGSTVERFHYDEMGRLATTQRDSVLTTYTYEGTGQLVRVDDGTEDLSFAHDLDDNPITYTEHTVNPRPPGGTLDGKRVVTGDDGTIYTTEDHFTNLTEYVDEE